MKLGVYPIQGRPLCYYVDSRSGGEQHFVNLTDHNGNGSCVCGDWSCRCVANMKKPHSLLSNETMCEHIRAAHLYNLAVQNECILSQ
jgi:hypothetical protein